MVSLVVAVVFVFGALTWPISEPKLPPYIPIPIPNAKPAPTPTVPPETPKAKPTHKPKLQPPQPVTLQAPYGNLAARCDELGKEIIEGAEKREQSMPNPNTNRTDYNDWYRENDGIFFRAQFYPYVASIHNELLSVHVDDPQLDRLIENAERNYKRRDSTDAQAVVDHPMLFHLSIREIKEIGERLRAVASQVPH
jgi:hypothetical protein